MTKEQTSTKNDERLNQLEKDLLKTKQRAEFEERRFGEHIQMYDNCISDLQGLSEFHDLNNPDKNYSIPLQYSFGLRMGLQLGKKVYERVRKESEEKFK